MFSGASRLNGSQIMPPNNRNSHSNGCAPRNHIIRGASPLGLPYTVTRSPLRRLASAFRFRADRAEALCAKEGRSCGALARPADRQAYSHT